MKSAFVHDHVLPSARSHTTGLWPCVLCDGATTVRFEKAGYPIRECAACGHRFVAAPVDAGHAARTYDDDYFFGGAAGYPNYFDEAPLLRAHGRDYAAVVGRHLRPGRILDVGAAAGFLVEGFIEAGWSATAIEPNPRMADEIRARLRIPVHTGTLEDFRSSARFDLVMMVQVLPHFVDVRRALHAAAAATAPGGAWLVEAWNRRDWGARLLGRHWHEYSPPTVLHWFTPDGVARLAAQHGLRPIAGGRPRKRLSGAHAKALWSYHCGGGRLRLLAEMADKLVPDDVAIPYPFSDLFWCLFRRQ